MPKAPNYARNAAIIAAYQRGETARAIGARQSPPVTASAITTILRRAGIPTRRGHGSGRPPLPVYAPDGTPYAASLAEAARRLGTSYQVVKNHGDVRDGALYLRRWPGGAAYAAERLAAASTREAA